MLTGGGCAAAWLEAPALSSDRDLAVLHSTEMLELNRALGAGGGEAGGCSVTPLWAKESCQSRRGQAMGEGWQGWPPEPEG